MTDLYTKIMLTVIALALVAIAVSGFDIVGSASADGHKVTKIAFCNEDGRHCVQISKGGRLQVYPRQLIPRTYRESDTQIFGKSTIANQAFKQMAEQGGCSTSENYIKGPWAVEV